MERNRESQVTVPFQQSLISGVIVALLVAVAALGVRRVTDSAYGWAEIALLVAGSFGVGFAGIWALLLYALRPERVRPVARVEPMRMDVAMPTIPLAFDARDARRFIDTALLRVNGVWSDKDGGSSQREMERKGWARADWDMAVAWLLEHGILEWKNEAAHQQGTRWNYEKLDKFVGREL